MGPSQGYIKKDREPSQGYIKKDREPSQGYIKEDREDRWDLARDTSRKTRRTGGT